MPFTPEIAFTEFGFCGPRDVVYNLRDLTRPTICDKIEVVFRGHGREKWEEKAVRIGGLFSWHILLVENVVQKGSCVRQRPISGVKKMQRSFTGTYRALRQEDPVWEIWHLQAQGPFYGRVELYFHQLGTSSPPKTRESTMERVMGWIVFRHRVFHDFFCFENYRVFLGGGIHGGEIQDSR
jgi:hypothetical protein